MKGCKFYIGMMLLLAAGLLVGCCGSNEPQLKQQNEIVVQTNVGKMMRGMPPRYIATYDDDGDLQAENLRIDAYFSGTTIKYLNAAKLHYDASEWKFWNNEEPGAQVHYYWPIEGSVYNPSSDNITVSSLDFVGYCPYSTPTYITGITYDANHDMTFSCSSLPMVDSVQNPLKEFVYGMVLDQNKTNAASGVPLTFVHPFARIKLQLAASHPDIVINSIAFKGIKNNGSFVYDHSESTSMWTPSGDAVNLVFTDTTEFNSNPASIQAIGEPFIVIPQTWEGEIEVNASWNDWGDTPVPHTVSTTIPAVTWQAGYSYAYTFYITPEDLTVNTTNFTEQW